MVEPRDASTIIVIRPCPEPARNGIEVLMVLRHPRNKFVADSYVFPGGALDQGDCEDRLQPFCRGLQPTEASKILCDMVSPERSLGSWIAGIRETFEEAGILLACSESGKLLSLQEESDAARFAGYRRDLLAGKIDFGKILEKEKLTLATDCVYYYSHWITPEPAPIRYDVRFFLAAWPEGQRACHDGVELTNHLWITPQEALRANGRGKFRMVLPTIMTMRELCAFGSVEEAIRSTRDKSIPALLTRLIERDGMLVEIMPDGSFYGPCPVEQKTD